MEEQETKSIFNPTVLPGGHYDTTTKTVVKQYPKLFAQYLLQRDDLEVTEVIDSEFPTVDTRQMDVLMKIVIDGQEALIHIEFQTADSWEQQMVLRNVGYIGRCIEAFGLPVYSFTIYLKPNAGARDPGRYLQEVIGHNVLVEYQVIRLIDLDGEAILDSDHVGLIPFAPLMRPPEGLAGMQWVARCVEKARSLPQDSISPMRRSNYLASLAIVSGVSHDYDAVRNLVQGGFMQESSVYQHLERTLRAELEVELQAEARAVQEEARAQIAAAQVEVRAAVEREYAVKNILNILEIRFRTPAVQLVKPALEKIDTIEHLNQLDREAMQAETLEAFMETLVRNGNVE